MNEIKSGKVENWYKPAKVKEKYKMLSDTKQK